MKQYHCDPNELFLPPPSPCPRTTSLPRYYTRTQTSLERWEPLSYYVTEIQECVGLKEVLTSRVTPSLSQRPGGLQGTLPSGDCDWNVYWGFSSRGEMCCNCAVVSGGQSLAGLCEWSVIFFWSSHNSKTSCVLAHVCSSLLQCYSHHQLNNWKQQNWLHFFSFSTDGLQGINYFFGIILVFTRSHVNTPSILEVFSLKNIDKINKVNSQSPIPMTPISHFSTVIFLCIHSNI